MNKLKHIILLLVVVLVSSSFTRAPSETGKPEPFLFKINRNPDADEVWYMVNLNSSGLPDDDHPIQVFWVRKSKNGETEPLTWIQNKYGYGVRVIQSYSKKYKTLKFRIVAYDALTIEVRRSAVGEYKAFTNIENREIEINRLFVQFEGSSQWFPKVSYVKLFGYDATSFNLVAQTITP